MRLLSQTEAAKRMGISRNTFRKLMFNNQFPFVLKLEKAKGKFLYFIYEEWLEEWLASHGQIASF